MSIETRKCVPTGRASKESLRIFKPISDYLIDTKIFNNDDIFFGYDDRKEWFLYDDAVFMYDFCIPKLKLVIEYQDKCWHPQPSLSKELLKEWMCLKSNLGAAAVVKKDELKRKLAEKNGFKVVYLWSEEGFENNFNKAKNSIFDCLENIETTRDISTIENLVSSEDFEVLIDSPTGYHKVVNFVNKPLKETFEINLKNGLSLICSHDHLVMNNGEWKKVETLLKGSFSINTKDGQVEIEEIKSLGERHTVDITVECLGNHYYSNNIVSHNCGKTLLAIAAGLEQLEAMGNEGLYQKLIVSRPVQPVGRDIGFLPGTLAEKMEPWIAPIRDNLEYLLNNKSGKKGQSRGRKKSDEPGGGSGVSGLSKDPFFELMQSKGLIEVEAITFIRGRSIPNAFIIIDEAQNLSMHELKTIVTRAGEGTKIVLTGDVEQIDNNHVDTFTNGLTHAVEKFKEYDISGHVTLLKGERSELATLASKIL